MNEQLRRDAAKLRELAAFANSVHYMIPTEHTAKMLLGIADNIVAAVETPGVDARLADHEQRLGNLETNSFTPAKKPLLQHTCKCDERPSTFNSTTEGPIPLSFKGRHLMMGLRDAMAEAFTAGYTTLSLSKARAAVARRMSELEAGRDQLVEAARYTSLHRAWAAERTEWRAERDKLKADLVKAQHEDANFRAHISDGDLKEAQAEIKSLRRDLVHAKAKAEGFVPKRDKLVVYKLGRLANYGCNIVETTWDGTMLRIDIA